MRRDSVESASIKGRSQRWLSGMNSPDAAWELVADPFTEARRGGRPRADDRLMLNGILSALCSGAVWRDMPERFGP